MLGMLNIAFAPTILGQSNPPATHSRLPELSDLIWGLLFLGAFVVAAILWVAILRRASRRQLKTILRRENALNEHYEDLFENAHDILFAHGDTGQLTALNRAGEQILGYSREEACGLKLTQLIVPEDRAAYLNVLELLQTGTERGVVEVSAIARKGHRVVLRINLRRQNLPGRPVRILGIAWDITRWRLAEEALRESEQQLRHSLQERIRIGRDLHDGIIQSIYAVGLGLGECRRLVHSNPAAEQRLDQSIAELNSVIRDVRNFIGGLDPEALKERGFDEALRSIVTGLDTGVSTTIDVKIDPVASNRLNPKQAAHLLQISREAITNALRHGNPARLRVSFQQCGTLFELEVRDDGTGFDPALISGTGLGLRNIDGRARELGGHSEIESIPHSGTRLIVRIPSADTDAN